VGHPCKDASASCFNSTNDHIVIHPRTNAAKITNFTERCAKLRCATKAHHERFSLTLFNAGGKSRAWDL